MIFENFLVFLSKIFCFTSFVNSNGSFPPPLSPEEEKHCVEKCKQGDKKCRELLIRHNLRLVAHIVKKYSSVGEADDLISVGSIGLIKGVESFEYGKGSSLATYVAKCIDNEILMYIRANKKHRQVMSLSQSVGQDKDGNDITLLEILPSKDESVFSKAETGVMMNSIYDLLPKVLKKREIDILSLRYGLFGNNPHTQLQVAQKLNISRSYVSRIESKAIAKLSKEL